MKVLSKSVEETDKIAKDFLNKIPRSVLGKATVVGLFGDLGSGKTTFSQALGKHLGINEFMTSPTFVIMKKYLLDHTTPSFTTLFHIDAYRLEKGHELEVLGFQELIKDPKNLIVIEWPERVIDILPKDLIKVYFKFISENEREIEI
jgi:tRNA threonylcarbamoyladenosine biosynthesis protein TsaE